MIVFLVFGIAMLLQGAFFAVLSIQSKNPNNLISTTGKLTQRKSYKNYRIKNRTVPNVTEYTYTYIVNGKRYHLRGNHYAHPRNVRKRVTIVYLRGFPRCAYEEHYSGTLEWLLAISLIALGAFCIIISFVVT